MKKTVCVVGAGPGGLPACKELLAAGFDVTVFERCERVGGRWARDLEQSPISGVWEELWMNTERETSEYSDFPWDAAMFKEDPEVQPDYRGVFPHWTEARAYVTAYAVKKGLMPHIKLNTVVKSITHREGGGWYVTTTNVSGTDEKRNEFDYLVIASGRYMKARHPLSEPDGVLSEFTGDIIHSYQLKSLASMDGKRVLTVGSSVSGCDIPAHLAARGKAAKVVACMRRIPHLLNKFTKTNVGSGTVMFPRIAVWLNRVLPESMTKNGLKGSLLEHFPQLCKETVKDPSLIPDPDVFVSAIGYGNDFVEMVQTERMTLKKGLASASGKSVTFGDGSTEEFDVIICCTGYEPENSFVDTEVLKPYIMRNINNGATELALYKLTLPVDHPDLAFVGMPNYIGPAMGALEMQGRYIAAIWTGKIPRPSKAAMTAWVERYREWRQAPHHDFDMSLEVQENLADELGVTPSIWQAMWNPKRLLTHGCVYNAYYRTNPAIDGPDVAKAAQRRLDFLHDHPHFKDQPSSLGWQH